MNVPMPMSKGSYTYDINTQTSAKGYTRTCHKWHVLGDKFSCPSVFWTLHCALSVIIQGQRLMSYSHLLLCIQLYIFQDVSLPKFFIHSLPSHSSNMCNPSFHYPNTLWYLQRTKSLIMEYPKWHPSEVHIFSQAFSFFLHLHILKRILCSITFDLYSCH